jgi:hypothetical protein
MATTGGGVMTNKFVADEDTGKVIASLIITKNEELHEKGIAEDILRALIKDKGVQDIDKCIDYLIEQGIFERVYLPVFKPGWNWGRVEEMIRQQRD